MYKGKKVSLVFPAYNEQDNIGKALSDFSSLGIFDEIIVVDNNSSDDTQKISERKGAKVVKEKRQGYGYALRKGMKAAQGDYIMLCEPDGTFLASDSLKLLKYLNDFDCVIGTRTNKTFIGKDANMSFFLRYGNIVLAKIIQVLFKTPPLSDCGCTYRAMRQAVVKKISPELTVGGSYFLPELTLVVLSHGHSLIEVPVRYKKRIGESKITGSPKRTVIVGVKMLFLVLKLRFTTIITKYLNQQELQKKG